ncbi:FAD-dependent oxidoreductase [Photobacterium damselae subsp. damselae]|uniref:FAD-dependent oxidoreductase n=1 Tax=Photobacterium damselae TaxID=38293 RepID=UPI000D05BFF4|nr:FAD-dependent oxidoreductase [Photobacterium damselae]PSB89351.1 FAD-dependent oxidoreductase [Photobacterium damselae subsp. damselae]
MSHPIIVIGSGFAAYQWVKSFRKLDQDTEITIITADNGDDYSKPDLSHVFSRQQRATDLVKQSATEFAQANSVKLITNTYVTAIDPQAKTVSIDAQVLTYSNLILATGSRAFVPPFAGNATDEIITLNSLQEFEQAQERLITAKRITVLGAGLIGTEIAMDLASSHKQVTLCDKASSILPAMLPPFLGSEVQHTMALNGVDFKLNRGISAINRHHQEMLVELDNGEIISSDVVIAAMALAKTLAGTATPVRLPASLVKAKTPWIPLNLAGKTVGSELTWEIQRNSDGYVAKAFHVETSELSGFIVSHDQAKAAFPLLRLLPGEVA